MDVLAFVDTIAQQGLYPLNLGGLHGMLKLKKLEDKEGIKADTESCWWSRFTFHSKAFDCTCGEWHGTNKAK